MKVLPFKATQPDSKPTNVKHSYERLNDFGDRMERIKASMNRINSLMASLRDTAKEIKE